jgi:hypothetical protein
MTAEIRRCNRDTEAKVRLFRERFSGLQEVYGTYGPSGRAYQVKDSVTDAVLLAHLTGKQPYGVYLLTGEMTRAVVADFDTEDILPPLDVIAGAHHYGLSCYLEKSKSKGYHVWGFADGNGISAAKARAVVRHILDEIGFPHTEVFPKQDRIPPGSGNYGNFINAPLFGDLVPKGRTVFLNVQDGSMRPYADQWALLQSVELISESLLDDIIEVNDIRVGIDPIPDKKMSLGVFLPLPGALPPCARRMLAEGVTAYQRDSCFRLAVNLRKVGLPYDLATATLLEWSQKNRPLGGKRIITRTEVQSQTASAYLNQYRGCGCDHPAVQPFCDPACTLFQWRESQTETESRPVLETNTIVGGGLDK